MRRFLSRRRLRSCLIGLEPQPSEQGIALFVALFLVLSPPFQPVLYGKPRAYQSEGEKSCTTDYLCGLAEVRFRNPATEQGGTNCQKSQSEENTEHVSHRRPYPKQREQRILIFIGSMADKDPHFGGQYSQNWWGICFLHLYAAATSRICAGLYGALDYLHLTTAPKILTPVNLAVGHWHGSPSDAYERRGMLDTGCLRPPKSCQQDRRCGFIRISDWWSKQSPSPVSCLDLFQTQRRQDYLESSSGRNNQS
jgi:hypothetical protein